MVFKFSRQNLIQYDIFRDPCHPRCRGLMLLETFTTLPISQLRANLPPFLAITEEVTGDPAFSMYNLALRYVLNFQNPNESVLRLSMKLQLMDSR